MTDLIIIGCGKTKQPHTTAAKDLYTSSYFAAKRHYAEVSGHPWMILSAQHGLIYPGEQIAPYERTLQHMGHDERAGWVTLVAEQWRQQAWDRAPVVELHMGRLYREQLQRAVGVAGQSARWVVPCEGMGIGQQLGWYRERRV